MNVTAIQNLATFPIPTLNPAPPVTTGSEVISQYGDATTVINGNSTLLKFTCYAKVFDGSSTTIYIDQSYSTYQIVERPGGVLTDATAEYTPNLVNGTFKTPDLVPPTVTITYPSSSTVPQDINVTATITDVGGVAPGSWVVTVNDVNAPIIDVVTITNGYKINASRTGVPLGSGYINVSARDLSSNTGVANKSVTVASSGFTFDPILSGFTNQSQPVVNALFNQVNKNTVRMFIGSSVLTYVNVTDKCDILGSATDGSINLSYIRYGVMTDGIYWVKVNGTSSLPPGSEVSATEAFTKDTQPPVVTVTGIQDSDGDGYAEAGELLTISYLVTDSNPTLVWIGDATNTTRPNGQLFYTPEKGNLIGNINTTIHARDVASLESQSAPFHIYNNYLAYITDSSLGTMVGLNLSITSVYDIFNTTAKAISISGANDAMHNPQLGEFNKTVTGGSKVVVDNRADEAIAAGALPQDVKIYATPVGMFDYSITVPHVTNATMILVRANSTMLNESITTRSFSQSNLKNLIDMNLIAIYSPTGVRLAGIDANGNFMLGWGNGPVTLVDKNLPQTIRVNYMDPSAGYSTAARGLSFDVGLNLTQGEYILAAVCMDSDRLGIIAQMPFIVTGQQNTTLSANLTAYPSGVPVRVDSTITGDYIGAVVLRNDVVYTGNMTVDFSSLGPGSLKEMNLYGDGNMSVMEKLISKIYITKGYGKFAKVQNSNSVEVPTDDLLQGNYYVYMFLENGGNLTAFNQVNVTIGSSPLQPATVKVNVFNASADAFEADTIKIWNGTWPGTVVSGSTTATFTGLVNATIYQLSVNRTGFLNVSSSITAVNGQRNVTVNLTQLGELITPRVVLSENGTVINNIILMEYQRANAEGNETIMYNMTVSGVNGNAQVAMEFPIRMMLHTPNITINGNPASYRIVNGTFDLNPGSGVITETNATIIVYNEFLNTGDEIRIRLVGGVYGDCAPVPNGDWVVTASDAGRIVQFLVGNTQSLPHFDYADVVKDNTITASDAGRIVQYLIGNRNKYYEST